MVDEADMRILAATAESAIRNHGKASTSFVQRTLGIGYNKAAELMEHLEAVGIVSKADHAGKRSILPPTTLTITAADGGQATGTLAEIGAALAMIEADTPPPPSPPAAGHNSDPYAVTADELRQFIERTEQLEAERKDVAEQIKEVMAEAKGRGYDTKALRKILALRKKKPDELAEEEAVLEVYKAALGMV